MKVCGVVIYLVVKKCLGIEGFKIFLPKSESAIDQCVYDTLSRPSPESSMEYIEID